MRALGVACACALALAYVAALFATTAIDDDRDDARVMKRRFASLSVVCALAWAPARVASDETMTLDAWRRTLGLAPPVGEARAVAYGMSVALAATLGETAARAREGRRDGRRTRRTTLAAFRDYAHAPLCEEWCFRACALATLMRSGASAASASALSSALFGAAHAHHYFGMRAKGADARTALRASATQFAFTFAFGLAACRVFLRRESLSAATACHCVCNYVGAPSARAFRDARAVAASALGVSLALVLLVFA
jgi:prenyl protein peptidase